MSSEDDVVPFGTTQETECLNQIKHNALCCHCIEKCLVKMWSWNWRCIGLQCSKLFNNAIRLIKKNNNHVIAFVIALFPYFSSLSHPRLFLPMIEKSLHTWCFCSKFWHTCKNCHVKRNCTKPKTKNNDFPVVKTLFPLFVVIFKHRCLWLFIEPDSWWWVFRS